MGKRISLRYVFVIGRVGRFALFREDYWHIVKRPHHRSDGDTTRLDRQHLINIYATKTTLKLVSYLSHDINIYLMIQKTVDLQNIVWLNHAITQNLFFEEIHNRHLFILHLIS